MEIKTIKSTNISAFFDQLVQSGKVVIAPVLKKSGKVFFEPVTILQPDSDRLYPNSIFGQICRFPQSGRTFFLHKNGRHRRHQRSVGKHTRNRGLGDFAPATVRHSIT